LEKGALQCNRPHKNEKEDQEARDNPRRWYAYSSAADGRFFNYQHYTSNNYVLFPEKMPFRKQANEPFAYNSAQNGLCIPELYLSLHTMSHWTIMVRKSLPHSRHDPTQNSFEFQRRHSAVDHADNCG